MQSKITLISILLGFSLVTVSVPGSVCTVGAQDMVFSEEETSDQGDGAVAPPVEGPPSEVLAQAISLYQSESDRKKEAAVQFQRVVEGETSDAPANVQKAQFFLGKSLYHLGYYQSALAIFDEITQAGVGHSYYNATLEWLAQLATQLPESAGIIERIGRYDLAELEKFNNTDNKKLYNQLIYLMGRYKYQQGEFDVAIELFQKMDTDSEFYVSSKFFEGITHVRLRRAQPAIAAFKEVIAKVDGGAEGVEDPDRLKNLAWLSLGRVYYTASIKNSAETGEMEVDGRVLGNAVEAWNKVEVSSEYWLDAMFEESWAFYLADEYARAMGNIHALNSPYFKDSYYPESIVIKAVVFYTACQWDNAMSMIQQFHDRYDPVQTELEAKLAEFQDNQQFFDFLQNVRAGKATLSDRIRGVVTTALSDRTILRHLEYHKMLDDESKRLNASPAEFKNSSLGARIDQDILLAKSFAVDQAGDLAKNRFNRLIEELRLLMQRVDEIDVEVSRGTRDGLTQDQGAAPPNTRGFNVEVDEEHQVWPFRGEYWRDELPFYRQQVTSQCGR